MDHRFLSTTRYPVDRDIEIDFDFDFAWQIPSNLSLTNEIVNLPSHPSPHPPHPR